VSQIAKAEEPQPVKRMNVNIPLELHNSFKSITAAEGLNMTDVLVEFIREYVGKYSPKQQKGRRK
jgi:ParG protein